MEETKTHESPNPLRLSAKNENKINAERSS